MLLQFHNLKQLLCQLAQTAMFAFSPVPRLASEMAKPTRNVNANVGIIREMAKKADFPKAVQVFYDRWAENYDKDLEAGGYAAPATCAEALSKVISDKNALIVDCAAGTGKAGEELAKRGFKRIDAVDFSQKSLDISATKGVYEKLICDCLGRNKLKGVEDGYYAGLICVGALSQGHLTHDAFYEFTRIVQKGAFMVLTIGRARVEGDTAQPEATVNKLEGALNDLVQRGVWELVEKVDIIYFSGQVANMYTIRRL